MRKTSKTNCNLDARLLLTTGELQQLLGCGRCSAVKLGNQAGARVEIGSRVFWSQAKLREFLE